MNEQGPEGGVPIPVPGRFFGQHPGPGMLVQYETAERKFAGSRDQNALNLRIRDLFDYGPVNMLKIA